MEPRSNDALLMNVLIMSSKEEHALSMGRRSNDAAVKDAQIKPSEEDCVRGMGHITILMTNLLHSRYMGQDMMKRLSLFLMLIIIKVMCAQSSISIIVG